MKWKIDQSAIVLISYKKPDGNGGMYDVLDNGNPAFEFPSDSTNSVIITLAEQVLTTIGRVPLLVSFMVEDEILSTFNIVLDVSENPGIDAAESEDYFSLSAAIDAAKKVVSEMLDPNAFASKKYVDGVIADLRDDLDEIADDARVFYVTISKSDDGSFAADKSVEVIRSAYDNGRIVKSVVDDDGEQVIIPLIGIIEGDTAMYVGDGANSNRIVISQTDILVSVHNDALPNVKTVNGTEPDENGNVYLEIQSGAIPAPETAEVGQTIVVKEVDENGKPILWEAADLPSGGSGSLNDNPLELINEITLEEDVHEVLFNTEADGTPLELEDFYVQVQAKSTTDNTAGHTTVNGVFLQNFGFVVSNTTAFSEYTITYFLNIGQAIIKGKRNGAGQGFSSSSIAAVVVNRPITSIRFHMAASHIDIQSGSNFKLYGRRVKK